MGNKVKKAFKSAVKKTKRGGEKAVKETKRYGKDAYDPAKVTNKILKRKGVGQRDRATVHRVVEYGVGVGTLGTQPLVKMGVDEGRSRAAQRKKQRRKKKNVRYR